jgi:hypothetical protein
MIPSRYRGQSQDFFKFYFVVRFSEPFLGLTDSAVYFTAHVFPPPHTHIEDLCLKLPVRAP